MGTKMQNLSQKFNQSSTDIVRNVQLIWQAKDLQLFARIKGISIVIIIKMIEDMNNFLNLNHFTIRSLLEC